MENMALHCTCPFPTNRKILLSMPRGLFFPGAYDMLHLQRGESRVLRPRPHSSTLPDWMGFRREFLSLKKGVFVMSDFASAVLASAERLSAIRIVPVLVLSSVEEGMTMCSILSRCGLPAAEITFRTSAAEDILKEASARFPDLYLGAGTILNPQDLHRAFRAGARFAVAPGFNPTVVKEAVENGFAFAPGVCTPGEIEQAYELGCRFLKFFPAEAAGGTAMLQAMSAPYKHLEIRYMPTGGVNRTNAAEYLALPQVAAVGGTWLGKASDLAAGNWDAVESAVKDAVRLVETLRQKS